MTREKELKVKDEVKIVHPGDHNGKVGTIVGSYTRSWPQKNLIHVEIPGVEHKLIFYREDLEPVE